MTPVATAEPVPVVALPLWPPGESDRGPAPDEPTVADAATLEEVVGSAWAALEAGFASGCRVCGGSVHPRWSAGAGVVGGRCDDCGTVLE